MTQLSSSARRSLKPLWGWVVLVALTQMGMSGRGCFSSGGDDGGGGSGGGSSSGGCNLDGKHYSIGESVPSLDGCNSCGCGPSGIACTARACTGGAGGYGGGGSGGVGGTAGSGGIGGTAGIGGVGGIAGSGGFGGGTQCNSSIGCPQPPCACLDEDGDQQCDNHCPTYECISGQCVDVSPDPVTCGGLLGTACPDGEYCKFLPSTRCGSGDQTGECTPKPEVCDDIYSPVCGCDGKTYSSGCSASAAGVSVKSINGACPSPGTLGVGESCGGFVAQPAPSCDNGLFCQYQAGALCGAADAPGQCVEIPESCPTTGDPVCGCNGVTYANACAAARAQVGILDLGRCNK